MHYCNRHKGVDTGYDAATSRKNLVNFGAVTSEITFLICISSCGYWRKSVYDLHCCAGIFKRIGQLKCWWVCLKRWCTCISYINLLGVYPVLMQLMWLNCVCRHQSALALIHHQRQHVCVSILLARGHHCYAGRAIRWALPRISGVIKIAICTYTVWLMVVPSRRNGNKWSSIWRACFLLLR